MATRTQTDASAPARLLVRLPLADMLLALHMPARVLPAATARASCPVCSLSWLDTRTAQQSGCWAWAWRGPPHATWTCLCKGLSRRALHC